MKKSFNLNSGVSVHAGNGLQYFFLHPRNKVTLLVQSKETKNLHMVTYWTTRRDWLALKRLANKFNRLAGGKIKGTLFKKSPIAQLAKLLNCPN